MLVIKLIALSLSYSIQSSSLLASFSLLSFLFVVHYYYLCKREKSCADEVALVDKIRTDVCTSARQLAGVCTL